MKNNHIPEIRFSGFTGDWEERKLGEISEKVTEKNKDNIYSETLTNSAEFGIINQRDFFDKDISNEKNLDGYYIVHPDDFVYNPRISNFAPVGPIKRNKLGRTGVMSPLYYVFRTHDVDKTFLEKYFSSNSWHKFMKLNGDSGARSDRFAIKDSIFREMPIPIPSLEEQSKIGNFLKQLDDTITHLQQELTTLKQTRKGFLQKMFPKEGEWVPEIRFPGFTEDWEQYKLNTVFKEFIVPMRDKPKEFSGTVPWTRIEDIEGRFINGTTSGQYVSEETIKSMNLKIIPKGSLIVSASATFGVVAIVNNDLITNQTFIGLVPNTNYNIDYLYAFFKSTNVQKKMKRESAGSTIFYISRKQFENMIGNFPIVEEQSKIGDFFKQLDDTIALHQRELDALKETKKAFLQKMFV